MPPLSRGEIGVLLQRTECVTPIPVTVFYHLLRAVPANRPSPFVPMLMHKSLFAAGTLFVTACAQNVTSASGSARFFGRWESIADVLPPVTLSVRQEGNTSMGQVWLSGTTYTLPATFTDSSVVLADPASSALAPIVGVLLPDGLLRVTIRAHAGDTSGTLHVLRKTD